MTQSLKGIFGASTLAVGVCSLMFTSPVSAFTFSGGGVGVSASDIGKSFNVVFDGNVNTTPVPGLSSLATITFLGFQSLTNGNTLANLQVSLTNTSSGGVTSRTSALGFNVDPNIIGASLATSSSTLFNKAVLNGSFPNQFGNIEVCFTSGPNCQGGANGGATTGTTGTFSPVLAFSGSVSSFTLSNFGVRYQSITGVSGGTSGTGKGTVTPPPPPPPPVTPKSVPEPTAIAALTLTGLAALRFRKRKETASLA